MEKQYQVYVSAYMESRSYNKKLYRKLVDKIKENCKSLFEKNPDVEIKITMSAKYQTPIIIISENEEVPEKVGLFEQEIIEALTNVGFEYIEGEEKDTYYKINFND